MQVGYYILFIFLLREIIVAGPVEILSVHRKILEPPQSGFKLQQLGSEFVFITPHSNHVINV